MAAEDSSNTDINTEQPTDAKPDGVANNDGVEKDADLQEAKAAWEDVDDSGTDVVLSDEELQRLTELAEPYIGKWNQLISTTNWEKGQIISEWRAKLDRFRSFLHGILR